MDPVEDARALVGLSRYGLTDALDDLAGSTDPAETTVIGWHVWTQTCELALALARHWSGSGKWLLRELLDCRGSPGPGLSWPGNRHSGGQARE